MNVEFHLINRADIFIIFFHEKKLYNYVYIKYIKIFNIKIALT